MNNGYFGSFGGLFIPETLSYALRELDELYNSTKDDVSFRTELEELYKIMLDDHPHYILQKNILLILAVLKYGSSERILIILVHIKSIIPSDRLC